MDGGDAVPFDIKVDEVPEGITKKMLGRISRVFVNFGKTP
jgi:hypothetical protein